VVVLTCQTWCAYIYTTTVWWCKCKQVTCFKFSIMTCHIVTGHQPSSKGATLWTILNFWSCPACIRLLCQKILHAHNKSNHYLAHTWIIFELQHKWVSAFSFHFDHGWGHYSTCTLMVMLENLAYSQQQPLFSLSAPTLIIVLLVMGGMNNLIEEPLTPHTSSHGPCTRMTHFPRVVDLQISIFIFDAWTWLALAGMIPLLKNIVPNCNEIQMIFLGANT